MNNTTNNSELVLDSPQGMVRYIYWVHGLIGIFSSFGNVIIIIVMNNKRNRGDVTSIMFTALAISDFMITVFGPFQYWFKVLNGHDFFAGNKYEDPLKHITQDSFIEVSTWILVLLSLQRMTCVAFPLYVKRCCTSKAVLAAIIFIYFFFPIINTLYVFLAFDIELNPDYYGADSKLYEMYPKDSLPNAFRIWDIYEFVSKIGLPIIFIIPSNVVIVLVLLRHRCAQRLRELHTLAIRTVSVCMIFVVTMVPRQVYKMFLRTIVAPHDDTYYPWDEIIFETCNLLEALNAALNFYVYVLSGTRFRGDVKALFERPLILIFRRLKLLRNTNSESVTTLSLKTLSSTLTGSFEAMTKRKTQW